MSLDRGDVRVKPKKLELSMKHPESPPTKPYIGEAPKLKLNDLPPNLRYVFFEKDHTFPVIIASDMNVEYV